MDEFFSGIIPIIIVIFVISGIIRSAKKSAAKQRQQQESTQEQQAPPPKPMSEIQRAFMMMTGLEEEQAKANSTARPSPSAQARTHMRAEGMHSTHEGIYSAHHEGLHSTHEGMHSTHHEGLHGKHEGQRSHEGTHGASAMAAYQGMGQQAAVNKYQNVQLDRYFADDEDDDIMLQSTRSRKRGKGSLKLFENQSDYVKAVIYSEILTRKTARQ